MRDQLRVQPAAATAGSNVGDRELSRRVAQLPRMEIMRKAVDAARNVPGVVSVRTDFELDRMYARYPSMGYRYPHAWGYPYGYGHPDLSVYDIDVVRPGAQARSTVAGTVAKIDQQSNTVTLKLSPSAVQSLEQGEQVTLNIGGRQATPSASPQTDARPQKEDKR